MSMQSKGRKPVFTTHARPLPAGGGWKNMPFFAAAERITGSVFSMLF
jgi:hypothetical protein